MPPLFDDVARELPEQEGPSWTISSGSPPPPPPVRHARGYAAFVDFAVDRGLQAAELLDTWRFATFVRTERARLQADDALRRSAVIFLGNSFVKFHPDLRWHDHVSNGLFLANDTTLVPVAGEPDTMIEVPESRYIGVERTVPALLDADESRFREFTRIVECFGWTQ
ncbi:hypothetical protein [Amnibacterium kyonggiense]